MARHNIFYIYKHIQTYTKIQLVWNWTRKVRVYDVQVKMNERQSNHDEAYYNYSSHKKFAFGINDITKEAIVDGDLDVDN